jgi:phage/plasmid-associated DNA primase
MSRNILDSAAGGAFTEKTIVESKDILESILQNYSQWHSERAHNPSNKVNSIEENSDWSTKMDTILAYINKQNIENVRLQELVGNNPENIDVNFVRNYGNNGFGYKNYNSYIKPPYVPNKYTTSSNVSSDLESTIRSFISTQKEINKEFISKYEKQDALFERVDQLTKEVLLIKEHHYSPKT